MAQQNYSIAKSSYKDILQSSSVVFGAEASYHLAYFEHKEAAWSCAVRGLGEAPEEGEERERSIPGGDISQGRRGRHRRAGVVRLHGVRGRW